MTYKLTNSTTILRIEDGAYIPADLANHDYSEYQAWLELGNTPEPADIPDPKIAIQAQIDQIEISTQENRGSREGWITLIRERAAAMGITDDAIIAEQNPYFKRLLETDNLIRSLRAQL